MDSRTEWEQATAGLRSSKGTAKKTSNEQVNLELELPTPDSGLPEHVADLPALAMSEADTPNEIVATREGQVLRDFQSSLTNSSEERESTSNLLHFWERIPRYHCGDIRGINHSTNAKDIGIVTYTFEDSGERYSLEMTPAQVLVEENGVEQTLFCYPDSTDELVELALVKMAMEEGDILDGYEMGPSLRKGTRLPSYGVHFTINKLMQLLKSWGRGRTYPAIKRSLLVLHKCNLAVRSTTKGGISASGAILPELLSYAQNGFDANNRNGYWTARFHPIISLGIHAGLYKQYNLQRTAQLRSNVSHAVAKLIILEGRNISSSTPYVLTFKRFRALTGMLHYSRESHARAKFCRDIKRLIKEGMLSDVEFSQTRRGKRVEDIEAKMYASAAFVKEVKASHKRANILQQRRQMREQLIRQEKTKGG